MDRWLLAGMALAMMVASTSFAADEFRCDTEIFVGTEKKPVQDSLTIFKGAEAYDFLLGKGEEITLYDFGRGQITLLDKGRKLRTTITTEELLRFTAAYKTRVAASDLFKFCTSPTFVETFASDRLSLTSPQLSYKVACIKPEFAAAGKRYREFADWSAQLNGMRPGSLPPFPRLELNKALAAHDFLPEEIERTISTTHLTGKRTETIRSSHRFNWQLSVQDRERIEQVETYLTTFTTTTVGEYLQLDKSKTTAAK